VLEKASPGLISGMGDGTPGAASFLAGASWGQSGSPSSSEGVGRAFQSRGSGVAVEEGSQRIHGEAALASAPSSVSKLSATVAVPQRHLQIQRAPDRSTSFWVFLAVAVVMCIKRLYEFRSRRGLALQGHGTDNEPGV
jgi:hypothetical protein